MVNYNKILKEFRGLVGFNREYNIEVEKSLLVSSSGATFQDAHPLISLTTLSAIAPDINSNFVPYATIGTQYSKRDVVKYNDRLYRALEDNTFDVAELDNKWELTNELSIWLSNMVDNTITSVVQSVLQKAIIASQGKETIANYPSVNTGASRTFLGGNKLSVILLQPKDNIGATLKIRVMTRKYPVQIVSNNFSGDVMQVNSNHEIIDLEVTPENSAGWYIVAEQDEGQATQTRDLVKEHEFFNLSGFVTDNPLSLEQTPETSRLGMDLGIVVACDFTDLFVRNKYDFINLIKLQFAVNCLKTYVYNPSARVNRTAMIASRADIMYALDGDNSKFARASGLSLDLRQAYETFILNTKGYNSRCLPCTKKGIAYRTIG